MSIALADYMRDIKTSSSIWLKASGKFPEFKGWADGYAAVYFRTVYFPWAYAHGY